MLYRLEFVRCGKAKCKTCAGTKGARGSAGLNNTGHGPYWYGYWREVVKRGVLRRGLRLRKIYIGKQLPELRPQLDTIGHMGCEITEDSDLGAPPPVSALSWRRRRRGAAVPPEVIPERKLKRA